jgi:1-deoxy-D-xylulose-5-phosphate reductoisomerase
VEFIDGTLLAQLSIVDMRSAILYALSYPDRKDSRLPFLDLFSLPDLAFKAPDTDRFPCLRLAYEALEAGHTYPVALNAANEVAVELFLSGGISFSLIPGIIESILERHVPAKACDLETILAIDRQTRHLARRLQLDEIGKSPPSRTA